VVTEGEIELQDEDVEFIDDGFETGEYPIPDLATPSFCKECKRYWQGECSCREVES
jgi:hypothetical protein